jgi:hypothetical protein
MEERLKQSAISWNTIRKRLVNLVGKLSWYAIVDYINRLQDLGTIDPAQVQEFLNEVHALGVVTVGQGDATNFIKNVLEKIKRNIPISDEEKETLQKLPEVIKQEAIEEDKTEGEVIPPEEIQKSPEAMVINTFTPELWDDVSLRATLPKYVDSSKNVFMYLKACGYKSGIWIPSPEYHASDPNLSTNKKKDLCKVVKYDYGMSGVTLKGPICGARYNQVYTLENIIEQAHSHATAHGYFPPKPFMAFAHPGCGCSILCYPPTSIGEIPDSAPGVPMHGNDEEKRPYKEYILGNARQFHVDRWTILDERAFKTTTPSVTPQLEREAVLTDEEIADMLGAKGLVATERKERLKRADKNWVENIKPIAVSDSFMYKSSLGTYRPIPNVYYGFQVSVNGPVSKVFLSDLSRIMLIPTNKIKDIKIQLAKAKEIEEGSFGKIDDDTFGIAMKIFTSNKILCYLPEFDEIMYVDNFIPYEKI